MFKCELSDNTCRTISVLKIVVKLAIENLNIFFHNNRNHNKQSGNNN